MSVVCFGCLLIVLVCPLSSVPGHTCSFGPGATFCPAATYICAPWILISMSLICRTAVTVTMTLCWNCHLPFDLIWFDRLRSNCDVSWPSVSPTDPCDGHMWSVCIIQSRWSNVTDLTGMSLVQENCQKADKIKSGVTGQSGRLGGVWLDKGMTSTRHGAWSNQSRCLWIWALPWWRVHSFHNCCHVEHQKNAKFPPWLQM